MEFFRELKENLEKNDMLYKIVKGATEFIGELTETLIKGSSEMDIVTQIGMDNKLTLKQELMC